MRPILVTLIIMALTNSTALCDQGAAQPGQKGYVERVVEWWHSLFQKPEQAAAPVAAPAQTPPRPSAPVSASIPTAPATSAPAPVAKAPAPVAQAPAPMSAAVAPVAERPVMPFAPLLSNLPTVNVPAPEALSPESFRQSDGSLEALRLRARQLAASLPVVAPIAIQPAIAPPRAAPPFVELAVAASTINRTKKLVTPAPALPGAPGPKGESRVVHRTVASQSAPRVIDPQEFKFRRELKLLETTPVVFERIDPLERDVMTLLNGLFAWLMYRGDDALGTLHDLGQATKLALVREKALAFEGWVLADAEQPALSALTLWRAVDAAVPEDKGYAQAALLTLSALSHEIRVAKSAPSDATVEKAAHRAGLVNEARAYVGLLQAERAFDHKSFTTARKLALAVPRSSWWELARYLAAASLIATGEDPHQAQIAGRELTELFRTVESPEVFDATAAMLGRIHFLLGNYKASHQYLAQVSRETNLFIDAAVDNAWALLRSGDRNHAVGNMFTLHTPYFDGAYMPESYFLQSLGYQESCQFGDALTTLKQFRSRYDNANRKLIDFNAAAKGSDSHEYYEDLVAYLSHRDSKLPGIVLRELGRRPEFLRRQKEINRVAHEKAAAVLVLPKSAPRVTAWLEPQIASMRASETASISRFLRVRSVEMQDELKYLAANVSLLEYEVFAGAGRNLALQGAQNFAVDAGKAAPKRQFEEGQEYWPYEDEIWEDELNNFRSKMLNGCAAVKGDSEETGRAPAAAGT